MSKFALLADSIARWSIILLAVLLPLFIMPSGAITTPQSKMLLATILVFIAAVFWCISVFLRGAIIPKNVIIVAAALLPIAYALSSLLAGWPGASVVSGLGEQDTVVSVCLWFAALLVAAAVFGGERRGIITLLRSVFVGSLILVIFQFLRLFFPDVLSLGALTSQIATVVGSWHDLGIVLGLYVILGMLLYRTEVAAGPLWRAVVLAATLCSFLFLIVVNMSDIWYVLAGVSGVLAIYLWFSSSLTLKELSLWGGLVVAALLFGYFGTALHDRLPSKMQVIAIEVRPSWGGTYLVGEQSIQESRTLFFGSGPNSFMRNWALHKPISVNTTQFWGFDFNAGVGTLPTAFVTLGIVGFIAWLAVTLAFLWSLWKQFKARVPLQSERLISFAIASGALYLFVFHVIYAPGVAITGLLFLSLGIFVAAMQGRTDAYAMGGMEGATPVLHDRYEAVGAGIVTAVVVLVSALSAQALTSDIIVNKSIREYAVTGNISETGVNLGRALSIWPSNDRAHRAAVELGILQLAQQAASAPSDDAARQALQATLSTAIEHGLTAISIDRNDYQNWLTLAQLYQELAGAGVSGAYEQARAAYTEARAENPTNPLPIFRLAQLEALQGNRDAALTDLEQVVALKPDFAAAYYLASQLLAQGGQLQEATQAAATTAQIAPEDPLAWYNLGTMLYALERYQESAAAFSQAVTLKSDYSNALFMQALSQYQLGEKTQALSLLIRVAELNPNDTTVPAMLKNLNAGKDPFAGLSDR